MPEITVIPARNKSGDIIRAAAYARVSSSSDDQFNSFNAQIRYYTELLKNSTNTVFVDMYADEGITGTSAAKRDEFQRLMSDCRKGKIDRILTKSVSRFARNTKDCLEAVRELKSLGVSVYFKKEKIDTGELSSEMLLTLYSQFAQEESMSISKNVRMGFRKRMQDGTYVPSSTPFGYIRVTWTAKGFKEIKWRCINRLQYGKKVCKCSPTIDEESLHKAVVAAINEFCDVKGDVAEILRQSVSELLDPNRNGSVLAAQQRLDELSRNMDELLRLATVPESSASAMADIQRFSEEMKGLREFIEGEKAKVSSSEKDTEQMKAVLERLEQENFSLSEYDDIIVRQIVEEVRIVDKQTTRIRFLGGMEVSQSV